MASRPLPPGRRGRGGRTASTLHLPDVKILSEAPVVANHATSYAEQLRSEPLPTPAAEPEQESADESVVVEPAAVKSVKAFVASLERESEPVIAAPALHHHVAAAAGEQPEGVVETAESTPKRFHHSLVDTSTAPNIAVEEPPERLSVNQTHVSMPPQPQQPAPTTPQHPPLPSVSTVSPTLLPTTVSPPVPPPVPPPASYCAETNSSPPALEGFHPFKLLLPIYAVPEVPETVNCVFDDEAVEMQKNIMKVVKKILGKDRSKLEDFKINARLFGNNFMDPHEYVESLFNDLDGNRALLLVPCLVSIQPDFMKRNSMLVAARTLRLRNLSKLEVGLDSADTEPPIDVSAPAKLSPSAATTHSTTTPTENEASSVVVVAAASATVAAASVVVAENSNSHEDEKLPGTAAVEPSSHLLHADPIDEVSPTTLQINRATSETDLVTSATLVMPTTKETEMPTHIVDADPVAILEPEFAIVFGADHSKAIDSLYEGTDDLESSSPLHSVRDLTTVTATAPNNEVPQVEMDESKSDAPLFEPDTSTVTQSMPHSTIVGATIGEKHTTSATLTSGASFMTVDTSVSSERSSLSSTSASDGQQTIVIVSPRNHTPPMRRKSTLSLFGDEIGDDDDDDDDEHEDKLGPTKKSSESPPTTSKSSVVTSPVTGNSSSSPESSFYEAESLFGEVISVAVKPASTPAPPIAKASRSGMLFGFASAGADSDSDSDSEFDD